MIYTGPHDRALKKKPRSVAVGIFDGVHRAHRRILRAAVMDARKHGTTPCVVTFHPHPDKVLFPGKKHTPDLMSIEHRVRTLMKEGIREIILIPFTRRFSSIEAEDFLERSLLGKISAGAICVGHDFCFGRYGRGNVAMLRERAQRLGYRLLVCPAVKHKGRVISSTHIRRDIERGRLSSAAAMLGRPVSIYGTVIRGRGRGRRIGFPTANIDPHHEALPPEGVYAAWGEWGGRKHRGVVHIGVRPTFGDRHKSVEAHFPGFEGNLYGKDIELFFIRKIRDIRKFASASDLHRAIIGDIRRAGRILA